MSDFARAAVGEGRSAVLATVSGDGRPHLVPIVYATLPGGEIVTAVDDKPKSTRRLRRLDNITGDPRVTLLIDSYDDDWAKLWWVRVDGVARVVPSPPPGAGEALAEKYPAYRDSPPAGPWIVIEPVSFHAWRATPSD